MEDSLRWKKRAEIYEERVNEDLNQNQVSEEPEQSYVAGHQQRKQQQINFPDLQTQCEKEDGVLLLPELDFTEEVAYPKPSVLAELDKVAVQSTINLYRKERDKAQSDALYYRNLAERLHEEKRDLKVRMAKQIETVRDLWRNKLLEGQSRSGRIVKAALKSW